MRLMSADDEPSTINHQGSYLAALRGFGFGR